MPTFAYSGRTRAGQIVSGERAAAPTYLRRPFAVAADPAAASVNYPIRNLLRQGELVREEVAVVTS